MIKIKEVPRCPESIGGGTPGLDSKALDSLLESLDDRIILSKEAGDTDVAEQLRLAKERLLANYNATGRIEVQSSRSILNNISQHSTVRRL